MSDSMPPEEAYSLFQQRIIENLRDNREWFISCIGYNYKFLADTWGCHVLMSARRLGEAHEYWYEDTKRTLSYGVEDGTKDLDHFKNSAFLAFWLKRMVPINECQRQARVFGTDDFDLIDVKKFILKSNEICALLIGFQICLFYEMSKLVTLNGNVVPLLPNRSERLKSIRFPPGLLADFAMVLKHKNMSPHGLYLMYRSLFTNLTPTER
jgi:hypothetical protein